jgi:putative transposase
LIEQNHPQLSIRRQCELLGLNRSSFYHEPAMETIENLRLMRRIDEQYLKTPFFGSRRMAAWLAREGEEVNRKRAKRLMGLVGLEAIHPGPRTTVRDRDHKVYPYLLRGVAIERRDQVWSSDITSIPMHQGFIYLTAVIDWFSRFVLSWSLSKSLDGRAVLPGDLGRSLEGREAGDLQHRSGVQYPVRSFTGRLESAEVSVSMDGRGRALDNVFVERLWRSLKYEEFYLKDYLSVAELESGLTIWFRFYNHDRPHQSLEYRTPADVYRSPGEARG